jgi:hypothetical protein
MNLRKWMLVAACLAFALSTIGSRAHAAGPIEFSLHSSDVQIHGYRPMAKDLALRQENKRLHFPIRSHHLFEQANPQSFEARFQYKLTDKLSLTNEYGTTSQGDSDPEFHAMMRFVLKF